MRAKDTDLEYTGERVVPNKMHRDVINWMLHLQRYIFALEYAVNKRVLDAACGAGYGMSLLSSVAKSVEGIDIDRKTLDWSRHNNHFYCPVKFRFLDLEKNKISGNFDCAVSFETIEHLDKPQFLIANIQDVLNREGVLVFSTPVKEPSNPRHKKSYTWDAVRKLVENNFSRNIIWYSQTREGIFRGRKRRALFAMGVAYKNLPPFSIRIERSGRRIGHFLKRKLRERLGLAPKSRW